MDDEPPTPNPTLPPPYRQENASTGEKGEKGEKGDGDGGSWKCFYKLAEQWVACCDAIVPAGNVSDTEHAKIPQNEFTINTFRGGDCSGGEMGGAAEASVALNGPSAEPFSFIPT